MRSVGPDYLTDVPGDVEADASGEAAGYTPELAAADPDRLAEVFANVDGEIHGAGDIDTASTIHSISKPFVYAMALADGGFEPVLAKVARPCSKTSDPVRRGQITRTPPRWRPRVRPGCHVRFGLVR